MTEGQVNMHGSDDHRCERVQHEGRQRKHKAESHSHVPFHLDYLNNSTLANGSADHGRKRFSVNLVFCPG